MSVIVKGMEMPETCVECECFDGEWLVCSITGFAQDSEELFEKRDDACPLVEVPKHGRLIDADELMEHIGRERLDSREQIAQMVSTAQTIIEAEE